jgi:hypothetical protein
MMGYGNLKYAQKYYSQWLFKNDIIFKDGGLCNLDMLYWEERIGSWAAKGKTERNLTVDYFSIFNSRKLIELMLSTKRNHRDTHFCTLFEQIVEHIYPEALNYPINPSRKIKNIKLMKKLHLYNLYREIFIRINKLKF